MTDPGRRPQLDGLRFFLFLMVFSVHYVPNPLDLEFFGYALPAFFLMSGFVIAHVLIGADHLPLGEKLRVFFLRRALRIFPTYFLVLGLLVAMGAVAYPGWYAAFLANMKLFAISLDPASPEMQAWIAGDWRNHNWHLWSLSVEEQFYVVFPFVLYLTPPHRRTLVLGALIACGIAFHVLCKVFVPQSFYGALLPVCLEYFGWGCLFAWWESQGRLARLSPSRTLTLSALAIVAIVSLQFARGATGFLQFQTSLYQTPVALAIAFFTWSVWSLPAAHPVYRLLALKPVVYLGTLAYPCYLVHLVALDIFRATGIRLPLGTALGEALGALFVTFALAAAIWHFYDKPIQELRRYLPYSRRRPRPVAVPA